MYGHQVTYIGLLCASPFNVAMLSLTLKRFNERVSGSSVAHLSDARLGTKGTPGFLYHGKKPSKYFSEIVE